MRRKAIVVVGLVWALASVRVVAQERQVPFDLEGRIIVITKATADELGLYREYPNLTEAILFQSGESSYVLEIRQQQDGRIMQERRPLTAAEVLELRIQMSDLVAERHPTAVLDQSGRFPLLLGDFILSYGFYGWALPASLGITDFTTATGLYLVTSGAGFFVPLLLTRDVEVTPAQATLYLGLATLGIYHGMAFYLLAVGDLPPDPRAIIGIPVLASVAEGIAGYFMAKPLGLAAPEAGLISFVGAVGAAEGALISLLTGSASRDNAAREIIGLSLAGSAGGLVLGRFMGDWTSVSEGDVLVIADTTALATMAVACLALLLEAHDEVTVSAIAAAGLAAGVTSGYLMQARRDYDIGKMSIVSLCMLGGSLVGSGLGYLVAPDAVFETPWLLPTMSFAGSTLGFGIGLALFGAPRASPAGSSTALTLSVHPEALLSFWGVTTRTIAPTPLVQLRLQY